jgi:hypothetical protein
MNNNNPVDISIRLVSCKCAEKTMSILWELLSINPSKSTCLLDANSSSEEDSDSDDGPSLDVIDEMRQEMIERLEKEIELNDCAAKVANDKNEILYNYHTALLGAVNASTAELIQKASMIVPA